MNEAFLYCWTDCKTNKLYIGSHKGHLDDGYICSSKIVLQEYAIRRADFTRQIIAHGTHEDIRELEAKLLSIVGAKHNPAFYNMHNCDGQFFNKGHTEETKRKISRNHKGIKCPHVTKRNLIDNPMRRPGIARLVATKRVSLQGSRNGMFGKRHTLQAKEAMSKSKSGEKNCNYGKIFSSETKKRMSEARKKYWEKKHAIRRA